MKILKPGKVEMRKFVCPDCGCVFVADESDLHFTPIEAKIKCPCCWLEQKWMRGEPYEEPTQSDLERMASLVYDAPQANANSWSEAAKMIAQYLIDHGVTFREG